MTVLCDMTSDRRVGRDLTVCEICRAPAERWARYVGPRGSGTRVKEVDAWVPVCACSQCYGRNFMGGAYELVTSEEAMRMQAMWEVHGT